jgi:hypothetical protein
MLIIGLKWHNENSLYINDRRTLISGVHLPTL